MHTAVGVRGTTMTGGASAFLFQEIVSSTRRLCVDAPETGREPAPSVVAHAAHPVQHDPTMQEVVLSAQRLLMRVKLALYPWKLRNMDASHAPLPIGQNLQKAKVHRRFL